MNYPKPRHPRKKYFERNPNRTRSANPENHSSSETEASYLKSLIESRKKITVIMKDGERFKGRIRYYDRDCFSVGLSTEKKKIFLRKENVVYISEE